MRSCPVIINSFNQPTFLKQIVGALGKLQVSDVIVLDQASSSPEVLDFLNDIRGTVTVIKLRENCGPHWFFMEGMALRMPRFYAYSDPDLRLNDKLPSDFVEQMVDLAIEIGASKIGMALDVSNIEDTIVYDIEIAGVKYTSLEWEQQFWARPVDHPKYEIYKAPVDTTFAVYDRTRFDSSLRHYRDVNVYDCMDTPDSYRVAGDFAAIHLPWSRSNPMPREEWEFYIESKISIHNY